MPSLHSLGYLFTYLPINITLTSLAHISDGSFQPKQYIDRPFNFYFLELPCTTTLWHRHAFRVAYFMRTGFHFFPFFLSPFLFPRLPKTNSVKGQGVSVGGFICNPIIIVIVQLFSHYSAFSVLRLCLLLIGLSHNWIHGQFTFCSTWPKFKFII